jgi:PKD repeat protein
MSRAAAQTYCVHQAGFTCPLGTVDEGQNLQTALDDAAGNASTTSSPNLITIAPGTYQPSTSGSGFSVTTANPLQIIGSGAGQTTISDSGGGTALSVDGTGASSTAVSDLTVSSSDTYDIEVDFATLERVAVDPIGAAEGIQMNDAAVKDTTVTLPGTSGTGILTSGGDAIDSNEIDDVTVEGGSIGIRASAGTTIHRAKLIGSSLPLFALAAAAYIDDSLLVGEDGMSAEELSNEEGSINALNDTIVAGSNPVVGVESDSSGSGGADIQIINSIVHGFPTAFQTSGSSATLEASFDNTDGAASGSNVSVSDAVAGDPDFVNPGAGDYHLAWNSPLIDASSLSTLGPSSTTDLDGNPRVVSYTHASTPVDIGAYEYQHRAPTAVASAAPSSATTGTAITFDGSRSSDPDDGDTLTYAWSFDDGATATGATVTHAFTTPGVHTATLTVTDPTGLASQQAVSVTETSPTAPPSNPTAPPSNPAPPHLTVVGKPSVTGNRVTLKLSCTGTIACSQIHVVETTVEKQKKRKRTVQVASASLRLNPGQTKTVTLTLNGNGSGLLKRSGRLPVTITVAMTTAGKTRTVKTAHATLHPPKKPPRHHPAADAIRAARSEVANGHRRNLGATDARH